MSRAKTITPAASPTVKMEEVNTKRILVTPAIATEWLARYNDGTDNVYNRTPGEVHVIKLARDMKEGRWADTGVPIIMGTHDKILDGRQRLEAIVISGQSIAFDVRFGIDPSAQAAMDRPRKRSVANDLQMNGVTNCHVVAATTNLILHWRSDKIMDRREVPTDSQVVQFEREHHDEIQLATAQGGSIRWRLPNCTITVIAAMFYEAVLVDEDACIDFFKKLASGEGLEARNPILALRNAILRYDRKRKPKRHEQLYQVVHAWNLWRSGRNAEMIRVPSTLSSNSFPRVK